MNRKKLLAICNNYNLAAALHTLERNCYTPREFCGYLSPSEILTLVDNGATTRENIEFVKMRKRKGESWRHWAYFYFPPQLEELWEKFHPDPHVLYF